MLLVMIVNPLLYISSTSSVHVIVSRYLSQYTNKERLIVDMIKIKFGLINLTFYACWLPNLINAVILYSNWDDLPRRLIVSIWYIMVRNYRSCQFLFLFIPKKYNVFDKIFLICFRPL